MVKIVFLELHELYYKNHILEIYEWERGSVIKDPSFESI